MALKITDETIDGVLASNEITVIDFWAEWCGPCKMLGPVIDDLAKENTDMVVGKLDISDNPITAAKYGITSIPSIIVFKNDKVIGRMVGAMPKVKIQQKINEFRGL